MALGMYLAHEGFTPEKYEEALKKLEAAGAGAPKGRTLHVALESGGSIQVFDGGNGAQRDQGLTARL